MARFGVSVAVTEESTEQRPEYKKVVPGVFKLEIGAAQVDRKDEGEPNETNTFVATVEVVEPEDLKGARFFSRYNLTHPKPIVQEIGQRQFSQLRRALKLGDVDGEKEESEVIDEMRMEPFIATVGYGKPYQKKVDGVPQTNDDGTPLMVTDNIEIKRYWYPDLDDAPPIGVTGAPANDNKPTARVVAKPATVAAPAKKPGETPWEAAKRRREEAARAA